MNLDKIDLKKLFIYILFWAVSFYLGLEAFSRSGEVRAIDVIYTFLFILPFVFIVSVHAYHLVPNYLAKSMFWAYGLTSICLLGTAYPIYSFSYVILSEWLFPEYYLVGIYTPLELIGFAIFFLLISSSLEFSRNWFEGLQAKTRVSELETEKVASELKALRAQVNPHFLFNSLNTIYNEALKKSDKAPTLILKLSEMLRYVVDKMDQELVSLEEEIEYLKNFVELHKERLNEPSKVRFLISGSFTSLKIAPLLLLNFVENAFKHADLTEEDAFTSIEISNIKKEITLKCVNSFFEDPSSKNNSSGSGIENAKRRLQLAYPNRHSLHINKSDNTYHLELKMELD
jgi:sensor histidine kinase YesM